MGCVLMASKTWELGKFSPYTSHGTYPHTSHGTFYFAPEHTKLNLREAMILDLSDELHELAAVAMRQLMASVSYRGANPTNIYAFGPHHSGLKAVLLSVDRLGEREGADQAAIGRTKDVLRLLRDVPIRQPHVGMDDDGDVLVFW